MMGWLRESFEAFRRRPEVTPAMLKGFLVVTVSAAMAIPLVLVALPYIEFFNDLAVQDKVKPEMVWRKVEGRATPGDLPPPAGALPREYVPYPFWFVRTDDSEASKKREAEVAEQAGVALDSGALEIPEAYRRPRPTLDLLKRGEKVYNSVCVVCHGPQGRGDGTVVSKGFPAPPSLLDNRARNFRDGRIFHIITVGQNRVMPSYAGTLEPLDRWAAVFYVRALQKMFAPEPEPAAAPATGAGPGGTR